MHVLLIDFFKILMISGMMVTLYRNAETFHKARIVLTEKIRK